MRIPKTSLDLGRVNYNQSTGRQRQQIANGLMDMYADTGNLSQILAAQVEEPWARKQQREQQDKLFEENQYNQRIEDETALQQIKMGGDARAEGAAAVESAKVQGEQFKWNMQEQRDVDKLDQLQTDKDNAEAQAQQADLAKTQANMDMVGAVGEGVGALAMGSINPAATIGG